MSAPALIDGDVASVDALAGRLAAVAEESAGAADRLTRLHAGSWLGAAATRFGDAAAQLPGKWTTASQAFDGAASAYRGYAAVLADAQADARRAVRWWDDASEATAAWRVRVDALPVGDPGRGEPDPGAAGRSEASALGDAARGRLDAAAVRAIRAIDAAAELAPHKPGFWSQLWHETESFADGLWDGTVGIVRFAWEFSPVRAMIDPTGFVHDVEATGKALWWDATHPVAFAQAIAHEWETDPAHALGELVPGLLLAAATGGGGLAATVVREGVVRGADLAITLTEKAATRWHDVRPLLTGDGGSASLQLLTFGTARKIASSTPLMERLVSGIEAETGMTFVRLGGRRYESPAGVTYEIGSGHGHRLLHMLAHSVPDSSKPKHTVFHDGVQLFKVIDEAWTKRLDSDVRSFLNLGSRVYVVPLGRVVGTEGEKTVNLVVDVKTGHLRTTYLTR